jgi:hypothetical protein
MNMEPTETPTGLIASAMSRRSVTGDGDDLALRLARALPTLANLSLEERTVIVADFMRVCLPGLFAEDNPQATRSRGGRPRERARDLWITVFYLRVRGANLPRGGLKRELSRIDTIAGSKVPLSLTRIKAIYGNRLNVKIAKDILSRAGSFDEVRRMIEAAAQVSEVADT